MFPNLYWDTFVRSKAAKKFEEQFDAATLTKFLGLDIDVLAAEKEEGIFSWLVQM